MNLRIPILIFLFPSITFCQTAVSGKVVDKTSGSAIAYATVGLLRQNAGTNSDENGNFNLAGNDIDRDTLVISAIGYETVKNAVSTVKLNSLIQLEKKILALREITIISKAHWRYNTLNKLDCSNNGL